MFFKETFGLKDRLIIRFYDPEIKGKDAGGRTLDDVLAWDDVHLERCHDYIQTLFPLPESSIHNSNAPLVNRKVMDGFHARPELRRRLRQSFLRMLAFYGFEVEQNSAPLVEEQTSRKDGTVPSPVKPTTTETDNPALKIVRASGWEGSFENWAGRFNHNHLRITRILRSLRVLGLQDECKAFFATLVEAFHDHKTSIGQRSMDYWASAAKAPLHITPDGPRIPWLKRRAEERGEDSSTPQASSPDTTDTTGGGIRLGEDPRAASPTNVAEAHSDDFITSALSSPSISVACSKSSLGSGTSSPVDEGYQGEDEQVAEDQTGKNKHDVDNKAGEDKQAVEGHVGDDKEGAEDSVDSFSALGERSPSLERKESTSSVDSLYKDPTPPRKRSPAPKHDMEDRGREDSEDAED